jgi:hypothetical protein
MISARTPLLSRSVRRWRIGCRVHKVNRDQLKQDVPTAGQNRRRGPNMAHLEYSRFVPQALPGVYPTNCSRY